ncbi:MAG: TetR/AcrR family transcriptional regulator [Deltaproteobacteria bacterium]|nr:TetR/AcrR family transcriptional regulator [Deltaproteobacteria bacterium]
MAEIRTLETRERILEGAAVAVARHGLAKLDMADVSQSAGVSRGTIYRYFPSRRDLLMHMARREGELLRERLLEELESVPAGAERLAVALRHAIAATREHPALQRLLETDPAFVLRALRVQLPGIKAQLGPILEPLLADTSLVREGGISAASLVDWMLRLMVSAYLFPDPDPEEMPRVVGAVYRALTSEEGAPRRTARRRTPKRRGS